MGLSTTSSTTPTLWPGFLITTVLLFVARGDRRLHRLARLQGRVRRRRRTGDRGGEADRASARAPRGRGARPGAVRDADDRSRCATRSPEEIRGSIERPRHELAVLRRGAAREGARADRLAAPGQRAPHRRDRRRGRGRVRGRRRHRRDVGRRRRPSQTRTRNVLPRALAFRRWGRGDPLGAGDRADRPDHRRRRLLCLYLIYLLRKPITWLFIAMFLAVALSPPVNFLNRYMKRGLAIAVVYLRCSAIDRRAGPAADPADRHPGQRPGRQRAEVRAGRAGLRQKNSTLRKLEKDYNITDKLQAEAAKLPSKLGERRRHAARHRLRDRSTACSR